MKTELKQLFFKGKQFPELTADSKSAMHCLISARAPQFGGVGAERVAERRPDGVGVDSQFVDGAQFPVKKMKVAAASNLSC